jgi:hypothetical protein
MARSKTARSQEGPSPDTTTRASDRPVVAVPRRWLIALPALVILPWLVAGLAFALSGGEPVAAPVPRQSAPSSAADRGPWGRLTVTPIVVSPPIEYVSTDLGRVDKPQWRLPGVSGETMSAFLTASGLAREDVDRIRQSARPDPAIGGLVAAPDADLLRRLEPGVRARLYVQLGRTPYNYDQAHSYRFQGTSPDDWLAGAPISDRTRALVAPLIYQNEGFLHFADLDLIRPGLDDEELLKLLKTLHRQATVLAKLSIEDLSEVAALVEYWGRGGRRTDIRPLLESIADGGPDRSIDIVHLLPAFARDHLYRYPRITAADLERPVIANCLWTSLNFFSAEPDDRFLDVPHALETLRTQYYIIEQGYQLGDVIAFLDREGDIFHAAVYIADDLVFSKNGTSPMSPWTIMSIDQVEAYYDTRADEPQLLVHRRKDL